MVKAADDAPGGDLQQLGDEHDDDDAAQPRQRELRLVVEACYVIEEVPN